MIRSVGEALLIIVTLFLLYPVAKQAFKHAFRKEPFSIEMLLTIAVLGAIWIHAAEEAFVVIVLFLIGEWLEGFVSKKASKGLQKLGSFIPSHIQIVAENGTLREVKAEDILTDQVMLVKPSQRFPADGVIVSGATFVDEALLTGEALPVPKNALDTVLAGSLNMQAAVHVKATQVGRHHFVARLIQLVEDAQTSKSRTMRIIQRFSHYYTPAIFLLGVLVAVCPPLLGLGTWHHAVYRGLATLLIGCPCALMISIPSALSAALTRAAWAGVLIKNAAAMETLWKLKHVAFDKTGTLTTGTFAVTAVTPLKTLPGQPSILPEELLQLAASLEQHFAHPLAKSILQASTRPCLPVSEAQLLPSMGVTGLVQQQPGQEPMHVALTSLPYALEKGFLQQNEAMPATAAQAQGGYTVVVVSCNQQALGFLTLSDTIRPDALQTIQALDKLKLQTVLLTGDHGTGAQYIAQVLGLVVHASQTPLDKQNFIKTLAHTGPVAMVGDGLNDAPALAAADVGIAMGGSTDMAVDAASVVLTQGRLSSLVFAIQLARRTSWVIRQNIALALIFKLIFLWMTVFGDARLWLAIFADTGATVFVTCNSLRLLAGKPPKNDSTIKK